MMHKLSSYELYKTIRQNNRLQEKRHPMFEKNRFAKFLIYFMVAYYACCFLLLGSSLPFAFEEECRSMEPYHLLDSGFFYMLILDFWMRFVVQQTPAQQAKPYMLLPIRRNFLLDIFLMRSGLSWGNLFFFFFLFPFGLLTIVKFYGFLGLFGWLFGYWLLFVCNSYWYLFCRALILKHMAWTLLPFALHAALVCACLLPDNSPLYDWFTDFIEGFFFWNPLHLLVPVAGIALLFWANRKIQSRMIYKEVAKVEEVELKSASEIKFLNRYGAIGEYLKMEIKLRLRNKQVRIQFFVGVGIMLFFSAAQWFSDIYDNGFMKSFICLYNYIILGLMTLAGIMCYEGNYIDGLMSRRESIYDLLRAKYYFNTLLLIIPLLLMIPTIVIGKIPLLMSLGYFCFTAGAIYPIIFQLAVYNNNTLPLNIKMTANTGNWYQNIATLAAMFVPIILEKLLTVCCGDTWGYVLLMIIGLAGMFTHRLWLRNIYTRFMARRYKNMESFRASRQH